MSKRTLFLVIPLLVVPALIAGSSTILAQGPTGSSPQAAVSAAFTYQGRLKDGSGNPVNSTCDFTFSLWDDPAAGSQAGSDCGVSGVPVVDGYFTVQLNAGGEFGGSAFTGGARWLQIAVQCAGDPAATALTPRQPLTATPYALGLMPGAQVVGAVSAGAALRGENTATSGNAYGILGRSASTDGTGVRGRAGAASGTTYGVYGQAVSPNGTGVYGTANIAVEGQSSGWLAVYGANTATDTTSTHIGVAGETYGTDIANRNNVAVQGYAVNPAGGVGVRGLTAGDGIAVLGEGNGSASTGVYGVAPTTGTVGMATAASGITYGVYGEADSESGTGVYGTAPYVAVEGESDSTNGTGVWGVANATSGTTWGVYGQAASTHGTGVYGYASAISGLTIGVWGWSNSTDGRGVEGYADATSGLNYGVYGQTNSTGGRAVYGHATATDGATQGVYGQSDGIYGTGVHGEATATSGWTIGVYGLSESIDGRGVTGYAAAASGLTSGVWGWSDSTGGRGVAGYAAAASGTTYGVYGESDSNYDYASGVYGYAAATTTGWTNGVYGQSNSTEGAGVYGRASAASGLTYGVLGHSDSTDGRGVYGSAPTPGWAGWFAGQVNITGLLFKGGGGFKIDDPLDPAHQYLYHSFVESPDMKNIYDGVVTLDPNGAAWVQLPDWFQTVNQDFRYQLTPVGAPMPNLYVAAKIEGNRFQIAGGVPGQEVSWLVTGIRHDPYAEANRIPVEQAKPAREQGTYLHPELYGQPASAGVDYDRRLAEPAATASPALGRPR